jgi:hypothetical protein
VKMWIGALILVWLALGTVAGAQRGIFRDDMTLDCKTSSDVAATMLAGPLNYAGVVPNIQCTNGRPRA